MASEIRPKKEAGESPPENDFIWAMILWKLFVKWGQL